MIPAIVFFVIFGVAAIIYARFRRRPTLEFNAKDWPTVEATIQLAAMELVGRGRNAVSLPCFAFSYVVDGEYYSGRFSLSGCDGRAATLLNAMIDRKIAVLYDPGKPSNFVIQDATIEGCTVNRVPD